MMETARRYIGNSVPRKEDAVLLAGRATFTDDIRLPGMLHLAVLRSPHARITAIETSAARELPSVIEVFESGAIASQPAVINAVVDALSHEGVTHIDMPASPARVWQALQQARNPA
jgi:CO/xanthine dehydrogenase Mo-binding subunit